MVLSLYVFEITIVFVIVFVDGVWVLSCEWVAMCVKGKVLILHDKVEIDGTAHAVEDFEIEKDVKAKCSSVCKRSRLDTTYRVLGSSAPRGNSLIGTHTAAVFLYGQFPHPKPTKMELTGLLQSGGATCLLSMADIVKYCLTNNTASSNYKNKIVSWICYEV
mgnify:CR=1 FL=1